VLRALGEQLVVLRRACWAMGLAVTVVLPREVSPLEVFEGVGG
jgi:hypothetical protein